jgi:hypothetical protein
MPEYAQFFGFDSHGQAHKLSEIEYGNVEIRIELAVNLCLPSIEIGVAEWTAD